MTMIDTKPTLKIPPVLLELSLVKPPSVPSARLVLA